RAGARARRRREALVYDIIKNIQPLLTVDACEGGTMKTLAAVLLLLGCGAPAVPEPAGSAPPTHAPATAPDAGSPPPDAGSPPPDAGTPPPAACVASTDLSNSLWDCGTVGALSVDAVTVTSWANGRAELSIKMH